MLSGCCGGVTCMCLCFHEVAEATSNFCLPPAEGQANVYATCDLGDVPETFS